MNNVMLRPVAVRTWTQPAYADRGETITVTGKTLKDNALKGRYFKGADGKKIMNVSEYADTASVPVLWAEWWDLMLMEDDVCYAYLGIETNRPSAANGGYELHIKQHTPDHGTWQNLYWATTYVPYRPYRAATGSNRIVDIHEVSGACTLKMIDPADGNVETVTATMLTDTDDLEARPTCQTGNVAGHHGTVDTTKTIALKLAGHIAEPIAEAIKIGGATADAYDPAAVRTRWNDGRTWNANSGYWATCYKYGTNYYEIQYKENGETVYDGIPVYYSLTREGGLLNRVDGKIIFSQGRRPFKAVFDDGLNIPEVDAG
jgi:hypothetical protein